MLQYYYTGVAATALTIAAGAYAIGALGAAEAAAGSGALFARAGPAVGSLVATAKASGLLDRVEQEVEQELESLGPSAGAEVQAVTSKLSQFQSTMDPAAANGGRTLSILRTTGFDVFGSGRRDLSPAFRALLGPGEMAAKLFGRHAEPTVLTAADRLGSIFPGSFVPRILVTTVNICPICADFIESKGGILFSPRLVIWPWWLQQ